ncbi:D-isomer specific 2-hydroxyacid dehydrogenase [Mycena floridula]|nr:D-isomer specific 2-hydroxyacid dehydrogenase [Mycena floridula]
MARYRLLGEVFWAKKEVDELLRPLAEVIPMECSTREELFQAFAPNGKYSDIVGLYHEHTSRSVTGDINKEFIDALPSSLKWIGHKGAGYDDVDVKACKARGISVSNTPGAVDEATATTALYLLISTMRNFALCETSLRANKFKPVIEGSSRDLSGKTIGILGLGGIGMALASMVRPFPMRVLYHSRKKVETAPDYCEYFPVLEDMLKEIDVLSIHVPLNPQTTGMVGDKVIRMMKPGSIIINTARGKVIDEPAVIKALKDGHLASVGLDVYPDEPHVNPELLEFPHITLLPHVGTENRDARCKMEVVALTNLRDFIQGKVGKNLVPECM